MNSNGPTATSLRGRMDSSRGLVLKSPCSWCKFTEKLSYWYLTTDPGHSFATAVSTPVAQNLKPIKCLRITLRIFYILHLTYIWCTPNIADVVFHTLQLFVYLLVFRGIIAWKHCRHVKIMIEKMSWSSKELKPIMTF